MGKANRGKQKNKGEEPVKINREEIDQSNDNLRQEMNKTKQPEAPAEKESDGMATAKNVTGNILGGLGQALTVVGAMGMGTYIFSAAISFMGCGTVVGVLSLMGGGMLISFLASYLITDNWLEKINATAQVA